MAHLIDLHALDAMEAPRWERVTNRNSRVIFTRPDWRERLRQPALIIDLFGRSAFLDAAIIASLRARASGA